MNLINPRELFQAAERLISDKKYSEAIKIFQRVLTLEKDNIGALGNISSLFFIIGDYHNSEFYVDQIIRINSNNWQALITKAQICDSLGKNALSVEYYKKIISIKKDIVEPYSLYTLALFRLKEYSKAVEICEISKNKFKNKIMPYLLSGICNTKLNNIDTAKSDFNKCIEISASDELTLRSKSVAYLHLGLFKEAFKTSFTQNLPNEEQFENFSNYNNAIKK